MNDYARNKKIKLYIALIFIVLILFFSTIMVVKKIYTGKIEDVKEAITRSTDLSIRKIHQTNIKDGIKIWVLDADTGDYIKGKNQVIMKNVSLQYFMNPDKPVYLTAEKGELNSRTYDMTVSGNVIIISEDKKIKSEVLKYDHKKRTITTDNKVIITGTDSELTADSMLFDLNTEIIELTGNVEGNHIENR